MKAARSRTLLMLRLFAKVARISMTILQSLRRSKKAAGYRVPLRVDEESGQINGSIELNKEGK